MKNKKQNPDLEGVLREFASLKGIPAAPGIVIGRAYVLEKAEFKLPRYWINKKEIPKEIERFKKALQDTHQELEKIKEKLCRFEGKEQINLLEAYRLILQDEMLTSNTFHSIKAEQINAEWALHKNLDKIQKVFQEMDSSHFRERTYDFNYIGERLQHHLIGKSEDYLKNIPKNAIMVAHELSPAETSQLIKYNIKGIATEIGGSTSHTAIISRALEIPSVVACAGLLANLKNGDWLILDGAQGVVLPKPSDEVIEKYEAHRQHQSDLQRTLLKEIHLPSETKDHHQIRLAANMELAEEIPSIKENGAQGIGLYRTEFLYLNRSLPSETELFENFKKILKETYPGYTTIRTLDLGGDKIASGQSSEEANPALGLRGTRLCLREKALFKTQLRAMLRASLFGKLKILFPLICDVEEFLKAKKVLQEVQAELKQSNIEYDTKIKVGVMIEVPSSVMVASELAREVDFFSIGTNDLIQYTMAIDRSNENVAYLYRPLHPAILRMLQKVLEAARQYRIEVSVCGEMAGDPLLILVLLGMGLHELSMNALSIPRAKKIIRSVNFAEAQSLFNQTMNLATASEMESYVKAELHQLLGDSFKEYALHSS